MTECTRRRYITVSFEIVGFGDTEDEARKDALEDFWSLDADEIVDMLDLTVESVSEGEACDDSECSICYPDEEE